LVIPNSVTTIGYSAFSFNIITTLTLGSGLTQFNAGEEFYFNRITRLIIPNNITRISNFTFAYNPLTELTLGTGITNIESGSFASPGLNDGNAEYISKLNTLIIPSNVTSISSEAFRNVPLTSLTIQGTQNRFNSTWTQIGFPAELKP
jgi:hypothetical protein